MSQPDVTSYLKESDYGSCGCGCGEQGRLKKPNRAGIRCVSQKCRCLTCRNKGNHKRGHERQSLGVKRLGVKVGKFMPTNEESLAGPLRYEHKDGTKARTVVTAYERERAQAEQARSIGDNRPFVAGYSTERKHTYYVIRDDDLESVVVALAETWSLEW